MRNEKRSKRKGMYNGRRLEIALSPISAVIVQDCGIMTPFFKAVFQLSRRMRFSILGVDISEPKRRDAQQHKNGASCGRREETLGDSVTVKALGDHWLLAV